MSAPVIHNSIDSFHRWHKSNDRHGSSGGSTAGNTDRRQRKQAVCMESDRHHCLHIYTRCRGYVILDSDTDYVSDAASAPMRAYHRQQRQCHCHHRLCHKSVLPLPLHCDEPRRLRQQPQFRTDA